MPPARGSALRSDKAPTRKTLFAAVQGNTESAGGAAMSQYFKRLQNHPGVPIASFLTAAFSFTAWDSGAHILLGFICSLLFWLPVLITARTQPIPKDEVDA
jgi:hypothetical protein